MRRASQHLTLAFSPRVSLAIITVAFLLALLTLLTLLTLLLLLLFVITVVIPTTSDPYSTPPTHQMSVQRAQRHRALLFSCFPRPEDSSRGMECIDVYGRKDTSSSNPITSCRLPNP